MDILIILIGTGSFFLALLLILLVISSTAPREIKGRRKVKEDIKKIKEQINSE